VEAFCREMLAARPRLDFIINNACQTVRRPPAFYDHMMEGERQSAGLLPEHVRKLVGAYEGLRGYDLLTTRQSAVSIRELAQSAELSQVPLLPEEMADQAHLFPAGRLDQDLQQVDLRDRNSWRLLLAEVPTVELLEVQLVNADDADARARQAHRERVGRGRAVLSAVQDHAAPAHQHGQGRTEHDDAHRGHRLPRGWHPHE
jgi:hypothetical protein